MSRVKQFISLIDRADAEPLQPGHFSDPTLGHLLVHLAFGDGVVQGDEFALLQRVRTDLGPAECMQWALERSQDPFDLGSLQGLLAAGESGLDILRLSARMVCLDGDIADEERAQLEGIAEATGLGSSEVDRVIGEIVAQGGGVTRADVATALRNMLWRVLIPRRGEIEAPDLIEAAPDESPVCVLDADNQEVGALFPDGLLARFETGAAYVRYEDVATYTRVPVPGAGFHLRDVHGTHYAMGDPRMSDVGALLDCLYRGESERKSGGP